MTGVGAAPQPRVRRVAPIFTVDVEDWFQVSAFDARIARAQWDTLESRVERNTDCILALLSDAGATGTFFTLGWVARRFPQLVARIAQAGHEIASHGFWHQRIPTIDETTFRDDVRSAKAALDDASGQKVTGYRAPSFSLTDDVLWAARILVEEGHEYDSSRFPIRRRGYGSATGQRAPHVLQTPAGPLMEYPPAVWSVAGFRVPVAGGGWFRQLPYRVVSTGFGAVLREGLPAVFYIHPWEVDPAQPRVAVPLITRVRHYRGLQQCEGHLKRLLASFAFQSFARARADAAMRSADDPGRAA